MKHAFVTAVIVALALPAAAFAQTASAPAGFAPASVVAPVTVAPAPAPLVRADVAGIQHRDDAATDAHVVDAAATAQGMHQGQGVALMVVGGAAMVGGLIVGDNAGTAVALGGLAIGLVGLYEYVR